MKHIKKFEIVNESKIFMADPSIIKTYASRIIPFYITGELKCDEKYLDEWLEMNKSKNKEDNTNVVCDLEVKAVRAVIGSDPTTHNGYLILRDDIERKNEKLERFIKKIIMK